MRLRRRRDTSLSPAELVRLLAEVDREAKGMPPWAAARFVRERLAEHGTDVPACYRAMRELRRG